MVSPANLMPNIIKRSNTDWNWKTLKNTILTEGLWKPFVDTVDPCSGRPHVGVGRRHRHDPRINQWHQPKPAQQIRALLGQGAWTYHLIKSLRLGWNCICCLYLGPLVVPTPLLRQKFLRWHEPANGHSLVLDTFKRPLIYQQYQAQGCGKNVKNKALQERWAVVMHGWQSESTDGRNVVEVGFSWLQWALHP